MKYSTLILFFIGLLFSCKVENNKIDLVVYPDYCGGCVSSNFSAIKNNNMQDKFTIYIDTTNIFILGFG